MRAALVEQLGDPPAVREVEEPARGEGEVLVEVTAAPLNPVDLSIGCGRFYERSPELPYVSGVEGFGLVLEARSSHPRPACTSRRAAAVAAPAASPSG